MGKRLLVIAALLLIGCVAAQTTMLDPTKQYAPIDPTKVRVFLDEKDIPGEYTKVAVIHAQGESSWTNENKMIAKAREKAAAIGANGIMVTHLEEPSSGAKVAAAIFGVGATRRGEIIAIRFDESAESKPDTVNTKE